MTRTFCISVLLAWVVLILTQATSRADDFRIENSVFTEEDEENEQGPSLRSTTIFHRGVVYDFLNDPPEVIIFDPANSRLILLDVERKLRTDLSPTIVRQAIERLKSLSVGTKDRRKQFLYDPIFEKNVDEETSEQVFDSPWMSYRVLAAGRKTARWFASITSFATGPRGSTRSFAPAAGRRFHGWSSTRSWPRDTRFPRGSSSR